MKSWADVHGEKEDKTKPVKNYNLEITLESTITFNTLDYDIEKILETTSMEDFITGFIKKWVS